jgi:hypothetical protein
MDWLKLIYGPCLNLLKIGGLIYLLVIVFGGGYFFATSILGVPTSSSSVLGAAFFFGVLGCIAVGIIGYEDTRRK